jgi:hypothetical protein
MDDYDVIYVPDDERNARGDRDHRSQTSVQTRPGYGPQVTVGSRRVTPGSRTILVPRRSMGQAQPTVIYQQPYQEPSAASRLIGDLTLGEALEMVAMGLAAIQPLPVAPTGQGDVGIDVDNLVVYQTALATHAKRDEQLRTIGSLLARLLK